MNYILKYNFIDVNNYSAKTHFEFATFDENSTAK